MEEVTLSLTLHVPSLVLLPSFREALAEYQAEGRHLNLSAETLPEYTAGLADRASTVLPGRVPESVFWGVVDGEYVGRVSLRHFLNPHLEQWGGHIGYEVRPHQPGPGLRSRAADRGASPYPCPGAEADAAALRRHQPGLGPHHRTGGWGLCGQHAQPGTGQGTGPGVLDQHMRLRGWRLSGSPPLPVDKLV